MAIKNKYGLLVSYSCEELINDISEDIVLFGEDYRVYAVLQHFGTVDGKIIDVDFIDYDIPTAAEFSDGIDEITLHQLQDDYREMIKSIENERVVLMTAKELLEKLLLQNSIT